MTTKVHEAVKVLALFNTSQFTVRPLQLMWNGARYNLGKPDFFHITRKGDERIYHFSLCDETEGTYFKLAFHSHSLMWWLEEIEDGTWL